MSEASKAAGTNDQMVKRVLDAMRERHPEEVSTLLNPDASKSAKAQARKCLAHGKDDLIQDMLLVDEPYRNRFGGVVRVTVSLALSCFIAMVVFAIIAVAFAVRGSGGAQVLTLVVLVEFFAGVLLMLRYRYMLSRYLELRITDTFAGA